MQSAKLQFMQQNNTTIGLAKAGVFSAVCQKTKVVVIWDVVGLAVAGHNFIWLTKFVMRHLIITRWVKRLYAVGIL